MKRVSAGIVKKSNLYLIAKRKEDDSLGGMWEFPGGKIEEGETSEECLHRELMEELGLTVTIEKFIGESVYTYPKGVIVLVAFLCHCNEEPSRLDAHSEYRWVGLQELEKYNLAPADIPLVQKLIQESL